MLKHILTVLLLSHIALAESTAETWCWTNEENPATKKPYTSKEEWDNDVIAWKKKKHSSTNIVNFIRAYRIYLNEKDKANSLGNDKVAHCYMGCRISQNINFKTADYLAWFKELNDITDCKLDSHFEEADYEATVVGANAGKNKSVRCETYCLENIPH